MRRPFKSELAASLLVAVIANRLNGATFQGITTKLQFLFVLRLPKNKRGEFLLNSPEIIRCSCPASTTLNAGTVYIERAGNVLL